MFAKASRKNVRLYVSAEPIRTIAAFWSFETERSSDEKKQYSCLYHQLREYLDKNYELIAEPQVDSDT